MNSMIAYLNGTYLPLEQVTIFAMDRGFLFGDGVYEVIPVYNLQPFRLDEHLNRFLRNLDAVAISIDIGSLKPIIYELIERNKPSAEQFVYLQATRGPSLSRDLKIPGHCEPTLFAFCMPLPDRQDEFMNGISTITVEDLRWGRCDIKSINLLPNILMRKKAEDMGASEAIFIRDRLALEGTSSNLFMVKGNVLYTPPLSNYLLGGITREVVLELAHANGIQALERDIYEEELAHADELMLTSSIKEIIPITKVNERPINQGAIGPVYVRLLNLYRAFKQAM
jgi:D-alanine transaminase